MGELGGFWEGREFCKKRLEGVFVKKINGRGHLGVINVIITVYTIQFTITNRYMF
jgi:hypothetical protein